jgi:methylmalonyl-CoA mutase
VNQYPNFNEILTDYPESAITQPGFYSSQMKDETKEFSGIETLVPFRAGETLEALRFRTDRFSQGHKRPSAFMVAIGDLAMRKARALFSCNFFASGGFEVIDSNGFSTVTEGLDAARQAAADIVVICSSDDDYATLVPELAAMMKKEILVVAGNPGCRPELEAIGVKNFIHVRSNLLEELSKYQELLNICE